MTTNPAVAAFIARLRTIDRKGLTVRDAVLLHTIMEHPGECGLDIAKRLGITNRSSLQSNFPRLIKRGLIEDRREREAQAIPARYFVTAAGTEFWHEIAPQN